MPKGCISILMPVKNTASYLPECLDSILNQTESNWELLAVNDHSTDDSFSILHAYAEKDSRIKIFQNTESGIIPALRLAYSKSIGDYITRMDSDDIMPKNKLELMKNKLITEGKNTVVTGLVEYFPKEEIGDGYLKYQQWLNKLTLAENNFDDIYRECVIASPCWMLHRADLDKCEAFKPNKYPEDYDLVFRFYKYGLKLKTIPEILHLWRDHDTRTSRNHEHYQDNSFYRLKLSYFLDLERNTNRPLVLWGTGVKGKKLARLLNEQNVKYIWMCNNSRKYGHEIMGKPIANYELTQDLVNPQIIVSVSSPKAQPIINRYMRMMSFEKYRHYWFF